MQAISSPTEDLSLLGNLIEDIKQLLSTYSLISLHHAYRTSNCVAHSLASHGFDFDTHSEWFSHAPDFILDAIRYDCNRM